VSHAATGPAWPGPHRLPATPQLPRALRERLALDFERLARGLPEDLAAHARERYAVDLTGSYAGRRVRLPIGKASGQLSLNLGQVRADASAGLGFVVLKTVIAEDRSGARSMEAWAVHETAMEVHRIRSRSNREGWTVTWKGRGWDRSFEDYLELYRGALEIGSASDMPVAASVKYHLPAGGDPFLAGEYLVTTGRLVEAARGSANLEMDFSPTLAGDDRSRDRETVLRWLSEAPALVKRTAGVRLGLKLMNALDSDEFQVEMLRAAALNPDVDYLVAFNRLFDPERGVAYGGFDLSGRNLMVLDRYAERYGPPQPCLSATPGFCATGNICSGRMLVEYALRGATSGQIHTFFQLPQSAYAASLGSHVAAALHLLLYHPDEGLIAWTAHLAETGILEAREGFLHFLDIAHATARHAA
jgi:hypothetical protein